MLAKKIFQMFIVGTGENFDYLLNNNIGGVIFFTQDIQSESRFKSLINEIKLKTKENLPPFLSVDQEGGRVERTENIRPKRFLSPKYAYIKGADFLIKQNVAMLSELKEFGINMNFAPCLDVDSNPNNPIIGERAFSSNPNDVCKGWDLVSNVYKKFNIIPVIKHFPGHGDADKDSHKELPKITLTINEMEQTHIAPFKYAVDKGTDAVMIAHLHCTCFDNEIIPASLSKNCIGYLRNTLNYNGLIISDDMYMQGLSDYSMTEACVIGIKAGINLFIYRNSSDTTLEVIENIIKLSENDAELRERIEYSYNKILELKQKYKIVN